MRMCTLNTYKNVYISLSLVVIFFVLNMAEVASTDCSQRIISRIRRKTFSSPPKEIPSELVDSYTRCGTIPIGSMYIDDSNRGQGYHFKFTRSDLENMLVSATNRKNSGAERARIPDRWLLNALDQFPVTNRSALVLGTVEPWVESILLSYGASHVTTVDYNRLTFEHINMTTYLASQFELLTDLKFDVIVSLSSLDHDGLFLKSTYCYMIP